MSRLIGETIMGLEFHRVIVDDETYYHEYKDYNNEYGGLLEEEIQIEMLMEQVVTEEIDIDEVNVELAIERIHSPGDQQTLLHYIAYLKEQADL
ncbi:hypothetical protein F2Y18_15780 [Bacillus cereus]|uniref:hypothetical protein n=1 Tax=Bacillus cereus TaxID=1396 RepID=UPI00122F7CA4|nr:hypothetical protein [Bacillus cereus]KAA2396104.1 hypothetical protein F2Y18_15780 [Bacillus cereus]